MDVVGKLLIEIRDDPAVDAIVEGRVRGYKPAAPVIHPETGVVITPGDLRGPGEYVPFVVLVGTPGVREIRLPISRPTVLVRCYGRTPQEAAALRWAVSNAIHHTGTRVHGNGLGIWDTWESSGGDQDQDPDTDQPFESLSIRAIASTQAVGVGS